MTYKIKSRLALITSALVLSSCSSQLADVQKFGVMAKEMRELAVEVTSDLHTSCIRQDELYKKYAARSRDINSSVELALPVTLSQEREIVDFLPPLSPRSEVDEMVIGEDGVTILPGGSSAEVPVIHEIVIDTNGVVIKNGSSSVVIDQGTAGHSNSSQSPAKLLDEGSWISNGERASTFEPIRKKNICSHERVQSNTLRYAVEALSIYGESLISLFSGNKEIVERTLNSSIDSIQSSAGILGIVGIASEQLSLFAPIGSLATNLLSPLLQLIANDESISNIRPIVVCRDSDIQNLAQIMDEALVLSYIKGSLKDEESIIDRYYETTYVALKNNLGDTLMSEEDLTKSYIQEMSFLRLRIEDSNRLRRNLSKLALEHKKVASGLAEGRSQDEVKKLCKDYDARISGSKSHSKSNPLIKPLTLQEKQKITNTLIHLHKNLE